VLKQLALVSAISLTMMMVMMVMVTGYENFAEDVKMMLGRKPNIVFRISWLVLSPLTMLVSQTQTARHQLRVSVHCSQARQNHVSAVSNVDSPVLCHSNSCPARLTRYVLLRCRQKNKIFFECFEGHVYIKLSHVVVFVQQQKPKM